MGYERIGKIGSRQMSKQVKFDIFLSQSFISRYLDGWGVDTSYYRLCCSRIYIVRDVNNIMLASSLSAFLSFSALFGFFSAKSNVCNSLPMVNMCVTSNPSLGLSSSYLTSEST